MPKEISLTLEQFKKIIGKEWQIYTDKIFSRCLCFGCEKSATIVDYKVSVNDLYDVILRGKCENCGDQLNRYLETGEHYAYVQRIKRIIKSN